MVKGAPLAPKNLEVCTTKYYKVLQKCYAGVLQKYYKVLEAYYNILEKYFAEELQKYHTKKVL